MFRNNMVFRKLIHVNACSRVIRKLKRILIYGTCLRDEYPEVLNEFSKDHVLLAVCLEEEHMNMVGFKLATIINSCKPIEIIVLTVDGSPHCVQLHMMVEECLKLVPGINVKHYVIYKGKTIEIPSKAIKTARYLTKVKKLLGE